MLNLEKTLSENSVVLLDFYTPACHTCKMLNPVIDMLSQEYSGKVSFIKVDATEETSLAEQHSIMSVPVMAIYKNGELKHRVQGALPKAKLEELIKPLL